MDLPNISIGDFASQLIESQVSKEGAKAFSSSSSGEKDQVDISNIVLSEDITNDILAESFGIKNTVSKPKVKSLREEKRKLKEEFSAILIKLKEIIEEMTTVGMIGVNMAGPQKAKKKKRKKKNVY